MKLIPFVLLALAAGCIVEVAPPPAPPPRPTPAPPNIDSPAAAQVADLYERQQWDAAQRAAEEKRLATEREAAAERDKVAAEAAKRRLEDEAKAAAAAKAEAVRSAPAKRYEATALIGRFVANQDAALAELEGKLVEVSGVVVGVEDGAVGMAGPRRGLFLSCDLAEDVETKEIAPLARGRRATVRGIVSEYRKHDWRKKWQEWLILTECRVKR